MVMVMVMVMVMLVVVRKCDGGRRFHGFVAS
jgi:hypothetical protein